MSKKLSFTTRTIHSGYEASENQGSLNPPVYMTSTYCFDDVEQGGARFAGEAQGHVHSRISNPTQAVLETRLADLEDAEALCQHPASMTHSTYEPEERRAGNTGAQPAGYRWAADPHGTSVSLSFTTG